MYVRHFVSAKNLLSFQILPLKIRHLFPCNQKIPGALSKLSKVHCQVGCSFLVCTEDIYEDSDVISHPITIATASNIC